MSFISNAYAQTVAGAGGDTMSSIMSMLPLLLMFVLMYFIMIRPQMKRQKEHRAMLAALGKGDPVVTTGGLVGKVVALSESTVELEIASGVVVQIQRQAIAQVLPK